MEVVTMEYEIRKRDSLIDYARNPRKNDHAVDAIASAIKEFGFRVPVLIKSDGSVIDGHLRLKAAKKIGLDDIPTLICDDLSDTQIKALRLSVNRMAELAEWDMDLLGLELQELDNMGFDVDLLGFDNLDDLLKNEDGGNDGLTDPDDVPEVEDNPYGVERGQIWQLGDHRLMCGDSTSKEDVDRLMGGEKADMVFTDPPYGVDYSGGIQFTKDGVKKENRKRLENDGDVSIYKRVAPIIGQFVDGPGYIWFAFTNAKDTIDAIDAIGQIHALIIWHKTNATYGALNANYKQRHEPCLYIKTKGSTLRWDGPTDERTVWEMKRDPVNNLHPTQKPVELAERAIGNHNADSVLDLFLGSGSTLIACEKTGRSCRGMEIDPHYCSVIIKRWEDFTGLKAEMING